MQSTAIKMSRPILGEGFTHGGNFPTTAFNLTKSPIVTSESDIFRSINFTQKLENIDDFLELRKKDFEFEGFTQSGFSRSGIFFRDFTISWVVGHADLLSTEVSDNGLENLNLSFFAKQSLKSKQFEYFFGHGAINSITSGSFIYCIREVVASNPAEAERNRELFKNITTEIYYNEDMEKEFLNIISENGVSVGASSRIASQGYFYSGTFCNSSTGAWFDQLREKQTSKESVEPVQITYLPYTNSTDFQTVFETLSEDEKSHLAGINFALQKDTAGVLMEDYAKVEYVRQSSYIVNSRDVCFSTMKEINQEATSLLDRFHGNNNTVLDNLSKEIHAGNYVGDGHKILAKYNEARKNCTYPPTPTPSPTPFSSSISSPASSISFRQITTLCLITVIFLTM